jgi:outer membrane biosynthesis protein TonB
VSANDGLSITSLRAKADAGEILRVGGAVKAPVVLERVEIVYPVRAREARVQGVVVVEAVIGRDGRVRDVRVLKPLPLGLT